MTALLEDRVTLWLSDHPNSTCEEIARAVRGRRESVRDILSGPHFTFNIVGGRVLYKLRGSLQEAPRRPQRRSQAQRMADLLSDGRWHTDAELWELGVGRPNSRASELRKRGLTVEHRKDSRQVLPSRAHQYRIVSGTLEEVADPAGVAATSSSLPLEAAAPHGEGGALNPRAYPDPLSRSGAVASSGLVADGAVSPYQEHPAGAAQLTLTGPAFRRSAAA